MSVSFMANNKVSFGMTQKERFDIIAKAAGENVKKGKISQRTEGKVQEVTTELASLIRNRGQQFGPDAPAFLEKAHQGFALSSATDNVRFAISYIERKLKGDPICKPAEFDRMALDLLA